MNMMALKRVLLGIGVIIFSLHSSLPPVAAAPLLPFPDLTHTWYRTVEAISYLKTQGVLGGYDDGTFRPHETINRAELLKIVFKGKSDVVPVGRRCFSDVNPDEWYAPYVCAAKNRGIVSGYKNGTFKPSEPVNFAEAIKIILSAYGHDVTESVGADWYKPYAEELERLEILPQHSYVPWGPLTRERAADLLWRILRQENDRFIPRLSEGCNTSAPLTAPTTVRVHDRERTFLLTLPRGYVSHDPNPLIVAFHGRTNSNAQVRSYMGLDAAITDSFIAYPAALSNDNGTYSWADPGNKAQEIRDIAFFDAIVETIAENYCIDMNRISTVGHSLGAWMANTVACVRGDVVMASATVGGDSVQTTCNGPAAAMIIHNPKDNLAPFSGAEKVRKLRTETNGCAWETVPLTSTALQCAQHKACAGHNDVVWCPHTIDTDYQGKFYPHTWPKTAAKEIREFLLSIR
jgi:polyhydroxybutyrate depolymerase